METKRCIRGDKCVHPDGPVLTLSEFHRDNKYKDGLAKVCAECRCEDQRKYYHKNQKDRIKKSREYYRKNKKRCLEQSRIRYKKNKKRIREKQKEWMEKNRKSVIKRHEQWKTNNPIKTLKHKLRMLQRALRDNNE